MGTAACDRCFPIGYEAAGADGVGAREPHVASGGPLLWRPRLGLSGRAAPRDPQATRDIRLQAGNCGSWGQEQESRGTGAERCYHQGAASARPLCCPWPLELSPFRKGSHRDSLRCRKSGEPQGPRLALRSRPHRRPSLACHPYLSGGGNPTRTGAGLEEGRCARTEMGGPRLRQRLPANGAGMKASPCLSRCSLR